MSIRYFCISCLLFACSLAGAEQLPPVNPYLADSPWAMIHAGSSATKISRVEGPSGDGGKNHALTNDEVKWKKLGPFDAGSAGYSSPYKNGKRAIWLGSHQSIFKLDADTLDTISTYAVRSGSYYSGDQIEKIIARFDAVQASGNRQALYDEVSKTIGSALADRHVTNLYGLLTHNNEKLFFYHDTVSGKRYLQFYGDEFEGEFDSPITLKRQWEIPHLHAKPFVPFAANMTHDGWIAVISHSGVLLLISQNFKQFYSLDLAKDQDQQLDSMQSFVRNGMAVDDQGGIYIVSKNFLARVQWTGKKLSQVTADGAWQVGYPAGARGSGTTPALMGWGDSEDHLLVLADGSDDDPHIMVFWRDAIPDDWQGIDGYSRRVAGVAEATFFEEQQATARIENSPPVKGYGIFAAAESPSQAVPKQGSVIKQFIADGLAASLPGSEAIGGTKWQWNPHTRTLDLVWQTPLMLAESICTISVNEVIYCIGRRADHFTLEGIDWQTGASLFHHALGSSLRYFSYNNLVVAPNGAVDLLGWLGMGLVRMEPKQ